MMTMIAMKVDMTLVGAMMIVMILGMVRGVDYGNSDDGGDDYDDCNNGGDDYGHSDDGGDDYSDADDGGDNFGYGDDYNFDGCDDKCNH